ncbi:MAG: small conductance mechanosensitive channel [Porticoccus sp.]|jgi:small conductance mechanosensitive channel|nr:MAG: mechanosensitive ion channel protein [Porticoccus sp.]
MERVMETIGNAIIFYGLKVVMAAVIFFVGKFVAGWLRGLVAGLMKKKDMDVAIQQFVSTLVYYAFLTFVCIAALGQLGIQTASLVAVVGAAGLAVGLALQGSLANFAAGVLILIFRPFRVGDYVEVAGVGGTVSKILVFTTELNTPDNKRIVIPNGQVMSGTITNYSTHDTRRVDLVIGISYGDDIDKAKAVLREVVEADKRVLADPAPNIAVTQLADSSVNLIVRPWVATGDYWGVYWDLTEAIKKRFDKEEISIPFPQRDVHLYPAAENA